MNAKLSILFYGKTSRKTKNSQLPIYLRVTIDGRRFELSTQRYIDPQKWSPQAGKAKGTSEEARSLNSYLDIVRGKIYDYQRDVTHAGEAFTVETLKAKLLGTDSKKRMLVLIFQQHNQKMKELIGFGYAKGTWTRFETTLGHVQNFLQEKYKMTDIDIRKIDNAFIHDFDFYLRSPHSVAKKTKTHYLRCANNSAVKYVKNFKKIILLCVANGWLEKNPFVNYKAKVKEVERAYLTEEELLSLATKECKTERLEQVRDIFLFSCYTGLAYIDVCKLTLGDIVLGMDGEKWISIHRQKTDVPSKVPLLPPAIAIIEKYAHHPYCQSTKKLLPVMSNQKMNEYIKELTSICGIQKELTFHCARHTFATTVTLTNGVSIESVSKMLGHKNVRTTQHYAKIVDQKVSQDMQALRQKLFQPKAVTLGIANES